MLKLKKLKLEFLFDKPVKPLNGIKYFFKKNCLTSKYFAKEFKKRKRKKPIKLLLKGKIKFKKSLIHLNFIIHNQK